MDESLDTWFKREVLPHEAALLRFLLRMWPNRHEVQDLRQDIYVRVYEAAAHMRPQPEARYRSVVQLCTGPTGDECGARVTCAVCEHCEEHCLTGGSGPCAAASWPRAKVEQAMAQLAHENELAFCEVCGGLEDPAQPHRRCRLRAQ